MTTIWKKILNFNEGETDQYGNTTGRFEDTILELPPESKIVHCGAQLDPMRYGWNVQIGIWFEVTAKFGFLEKHRFRVFGTGEEFTLLEGEKHIKTVVINKGERVWHVYHSIVEE